MDTLVKFFFVFVIFIHTNEAAYLVPSKILIQEGTSYTVLLKEDGVNPTHCYIHDGKTKYMVDLTKAGLKPEPVTHALPDGEDSETNKITSLGNNMCGFKMDNVSTNTITSWQLILVDETGKNFTSTLQVIVYSRKPRHEKKSAYVGSSFSVDCAGSTVEDDVKKINYCHMYHPNGQLVVNGDERCYYTIDVSKLSDFGVWKCLLSYQESMVELEKHIEYVVMEKDKVETWYTEKDEHIEIGCKVDYASSDTKFCTMVRPDGKQFKILPGLATDRYSALGSDLKNAICELQISKPIKESERGLWRCEHRSFVYSSPIGGFISVPGGARNTAKVELPQNVLVHVNKTLSVSCRVPYSSPYCYMRGPDGLIYPIENDRETTVGLCSFTKSEVQLKDNGTWLCGFGRTTGEPDDIYKFEVYIPEVPSILPEQQSIEARTYSSVKLKCSTAGIGDYPLQYCRFLSPNGDMYQIGNLETSDRISYEGRGIEKGDCGIKIRDLQKSDEGTWSCITRIGTDFKEKEIYSNIHVSVSGGLSVASTIGIVAGVAVVICGLGIMVVLRWRTRRLFGNIGNPFRRNITARSSNSSQNSTVAFDITDSNPSSTTNYSTVDNTNVRYRPS